MGLGLGKRVKKGRVQVTFVWLPTEGLRKFPSQNMKIQKNFEKNWRNSKKCL
jgi:hypothetical protein